MYSPIDEIGQIGGPCPFASTGFNNFEPAQGEMPRPCGPVDNCQVQGEGQEPHRDIGGLLHHLHERGGERGPRGEGEQPRYGGEQGGCGEPQGGCGEPQGGCGEPQGGCGEPQGGCQQESPQWQSGTQVQVWGDPHDSVNGQHVSDWSSPAGTTGVCPGNQAATTEEVFLNGNNEVDVSAPAANVQANSARVGQNLSGVGAGAQVMEMINGQLTDVGSAGQLGLSNGWNNGQQLSTGQTVKMSNGESVSWDGQGTVTMNQS